MNLLQCSPLCDSQGKVKYFIGAQIDVSGLALDGAQMESLIELQSRYRDPDVESVAELPQARQKDDFEELCELFSPRELNTVREHGGDLFQPLNNRVNNFSRRTWLQRENSFDSVAEAIRLQDMKTPLGRGCLSGVYENVSFLLPILPLPPILSCYSIFSFVPFRHFAFYLHRHLFKSLGCYSLLSFLELAVHLQLRMNFCRQ